jgi:hypothetical protein
MPTPRSNATPTNCRAGLKIASTPPYTSSPAVAASA